MSKGLTLKDLFPGAHGILESRWEEAVNSPFGARGRIEKEEMDKLLLPAHRAAEIMGVSESTARRWLYEQDARFIRHQGIQRFMKEDVVRIAKLRFERLKLRKKK